MIVTLSKNLLFVRPLYFPDKNLFVIAYENIIEVINVHNNIIWKLELESKIKNLEYYNICKAEFYAALEHGEIKLCNIEYKESNTVMKLENEIVNVFYSNKNVLVIEKDSINLYHDLDINKKKQISDKTFNEIAYSEKLGIIGLVNNLTVSVLSVNDVKSLSFNVIKRSKNQRLTAVACHPTEPIIATGESTGKIYIWWDVNVSLQRFTIFHWHFLSLRTLEFSYNGEYLFSGGHEQVLVRWEISVTEHKQKLSCYPRLESDIESIRSCVHANGEYFIITLADNSVRVLGNSQGTFERIASYSGLIQRPLTLHKKVEKLCQLNPIGLRSCFNLPAKFNSCVLLNGHEGKLQFYDLNRQATEHHLDVACQNWPTESENYLIPGFIQIQLAAISNCGRFIATYECLGVPKSPMIGQQKLRVLIWNEDKQNYELEWKAEMDNLEKVCDIVFHPVDNRYLMCITDKMELLLFERNVQHEVPSWHIISSIDLDEILYRFKVKITTSIKNSPTKMVTEENLSKNGDGLLVVTKCDCLIVYNWNHLTKCGTKPVFAVNLETLLEDLNMEDEDKKLLNSTITSAAIFNHNVDLNTYRIILGLPTGLVVIETLIDSQLSIELKPIAGAISKCGVKCLKSYPVNLGSNSKVAVLFENSDHVTIISVWNDASVNNRIVSVPVLDDIAWVPVNDRIEWVLVGLKSDNNLRSIVICEDVMSHHFQPNKVAEIKQTSNNLISAIEEIQQLPKKENSVCRRSNKSFEFEFRSYSVFPIPDPSMLFYLMNDI